ncbi:Protein SRT-61 [Aphelenchoides avenae]|nr:Protein SRT-61 [Aphelenchus avenae]
MHAATGFFNVFQTTWNPIFQKALGVIATPAYVLYAVVTIILSFNRLVQITSPKLDQRMFSKRAMKLWHLLSLVFFVAFAAALASPWASIVYLPELWSWSYDYDRPYSATVQQCEMYIEVGGIFVSGLIYVLIFAVIVWKRRMMQATRVITATDRKFLIQAIAITLYCSVLNVMWHHYQLFLPDTKAAYMALNFMWIGNGAVNPIAYFIVNATIRQKVLSRRKPGATKLGQQTIAFPATQLFTKSPATSDPASKINERKEELRNAVERFSTCGQKTVFVL